MTMGNKPLESIVGKGESAGIQHFLHFSHCFLPYIGRIAALESQRNCHLERLSI